MAAEAPNVGCVLVRLSEADRFKHHVVTIYPESSGDFIYADRLHKSGAYRPSAGKSIFRFPGKILKGLKDRRHSFPFRRTLVRGLRFGSIGLATWRVGVAVRQFRPDVIHVHTLPGFIPGLMMKKLFNKPLIHTVPSVFSQRVDADYGWMPKVYARFHPWVDLFFTGSSRDELTGVGIPGSKIQEIHGGVDLEAINEVLLVRESHYRDVRQAIGLPEDACIALSVGRLHSSKGHEFALEALPALLDRFPALHWVVLGEGRDLACAPVLREVGHLGQKRRGGCLADAGNGVEQFALTPQFRVAIDMVSNERLRPLDLLGEVGEHLLDRLAHGPD